MSDSGETGKVDVQEESTEQSSNKRSLDTEGDDSERNKRTATGRRTISIKPLHANHTLTEESSKVVSPSSKPANTGSAIQATTVGDSMLKIIVPNSQAGALIGKGGCAIRMVRETSGAKVNVSDNSGVDRMVSFFLKE